MNCCNYFAMWNYIHTFAKPDLTNNKFTINKHLLLYVMIGRMWCLHAGTRGCSSPRIHSMGWPVDLL